MFHDSQDVAFFLFPFENGYRPMRPPPPPGADFQECGTVISDTFVTVLQRERDEAARKKTTIVTTVKDLNTGEPNKKQEAAKARAQATAKSDALKKLRTEVQAEEQRAADLEAQAKAARWSFTLKRVCDSAATLAKLLSETAWTSLQIV